jgi:hypothetical protein
MGASERRKKIMAEHAKEVNLASLQLETNLFSFMRFVLLVVRRKNCSLRGCKDRVCC